MCKKAMLSQPMFGKTEEEIVSAREKAVQVLKARGYEIINTRFTDQWFAPEKMRERGVENIPLCFLAKSLESMSKCHAVFFCEGWEGYRGCRIEHEAAKLYGMTIIYEIAQNTLFVSEASSEVAHEKPPMIGYPVA